MKLEEINNISRLVVFVFCIVDALSACEGRQRFFDYNNSIPFSDKPVTCGIIDTDTPKPALSHIKSLTTYQATEYKHYFPSSEVLHQTISQETARHKKQIFISNRNKVEVNKIRKLRCIQQKNFSYNTHL